MIHALAGQNFASAEQFVKELNKVRLANKQKWFQYVGEVNGKQVELKTFDCSYLQIFRVNGMNDTPAMDITPTAWKEFMLKRLK